MSLQELLRESVAVLQQAGVPSPEVDARELVMFSLGLSRTALLTRAGESVAASDLIAVRTLIEQRASRVPLQHLLGEVNWGGLKLKCDARALVPRPETEALLQLVLQEPAAQPHPRVLDVGTGSGALALGLKAAWPDAQVTATDLSSQALSLARENAELNRLSLDLVQGHLCAGLSGPFDLIVSNPPYLPEGDRQSAQPEVQHDPELALYSGADGLTLARELVRQARSLLREGGVLWLELDPRNVNVLAATMTDWETQVCPDLSGRERFLRAVPVGGPLSYR